MVFQMKKMYQKPTIFYNFHPINLLLFGILNHISLILNEIIYGRCLKILIMMCFSILILMHFMISRVILLASWFLFIFYQIFLVKSLVVQMLFQKPFGWIVGSLHFHWPCSYLVVKMHQITVVAYIQTVNLNLKIRFSHSIIFYLMHSTFILS